MKFLLLLSFLAPVDRTQLINEDGTSLESLIKQASQEFLELKVHESGATLKKAIDLCIYSQPYKTQETDLMEMTALEMVLREENPAYPRQLDERTFAGREEFLRYIPERFKVQVDAAKIPRRNIQKSDLASGTTKIFQFGKEIKMPTSMSLGNHLVHLARNGNLEAHWLKIEPTKIESQKIWERRMPVSLAKKELHQKPLDLSFKTDSFPPEPLETEARSEKSLWKSPWFWVGTGLIAGLAGYGVYELSRPSQKIRTP